MDLSCVLMLTLMVGRQEAGEVRLAETSGRVLVLSEGRLFREHDGTRTELGCTALQGPGRVLELAADPAGLTFVAAERGLFVLGPLVDVLDEVERLEDAPRGTPSSVHVDAARRVWLATEEGVGALDPSFFHGRLLATESLGAPPYRVRAAPGGKLLVQWAGGELVHDPAALPGPRLTSLRVDGEPLAPGAELERESGAELALELAGEGAGGATFRYRFDGHQVWRTLEASARLEAPAPGSHTLELVAEDEDLDRSEPFLVRVRVPYPRRYSGSFVVSAALASAALLWLLFAWGSSAGGRPVMRALVSAGLALVLALQVLAGLVPHAKGWPFIGFSMYTRKYERDSLVYAERIVVLRPDGGESVVQPQSAGVVVDEPWEVMRPLIDKGEVALRAYLEAWLARHPGQTACGLQVQAQRSRLTSRGPVAVAPLVLAHYRERSGG